MKKYVVAVCLLLSTIVAPSFVSAQDVDPSPNASACISLMSTGLRYRARDAMTNFEVSLLQDFLQSKGYLSSEPTGYFGLLTLQAVKNFQRDNGIDQTGYVGPMTRATIKKLSCNGDVSPIPFGGTYSEEKLPTHTLVDGQNVIYRYKVTAPATNDVVIKGDTLYINQTGNLINIIRLQAWNSASTNSGLITAVHAPDFDYSQASGQKTVNFTFATPVVIPAGQTRYFQAIAIIDAHKDSAYFTTGHKGLSDMTLKASATSEPSITIQGTAGNQVSTSQLNIKLGEPFKISGTPKNLEGLSYGYGPGQYARAFFFGPIFNNSCGNNEASEKTWVMTCTPNTIGTGTFYIEIYKNGNTYRSNSIVVNVGSQSPDTKQILKIYSPAQGDVWREGTAYTISWSPASGDFDYYQVMLGNKLDLTHLSGGPVYTAVPRNSTSVTFDPRNLSSSFIQTWMINSNYQFSEEAIRKNFFVVVQALKSFDNGKGRLVGEGSGGVFSILPATGATRPTVHVYYPTANSVFTTGSPIQLGFSSSNTLATFNVRLVGKAYSHDYGNVNPPETGHKLSFAIPSDALPSNYTSLSGYQFQIYYNGSLVGSSPSFTINRPSTQPTPSLNVLNPQPNYAFTRGTTFNVRWATNYINSYVPVHMELISSNGTTYRVAQSVPNNDSYNLSISTDIHGMRIPVGTYTFRVCADQGKDYCDSIGPITVTDQG